MENYTVYIQYSFSDSISTTVERRVRTTSRILLAHKSSPFTFFLALWPVEPIMYSFFQARSTTGCLKM